MRLDPNIIRQQISNLLTSYPELAEDEQLRADMIEGETDAKEFLTKIVRKIEDAEALCEGTAARIKELSERKARFERRQDALRDLAHKIMSAADLRKIELAIATLSIRTVPPKVIIIDEAALPDIACKFIRKPDLTKIKELLNEEVHYCAGAEMSNGGTTLSIRVK